MLPALALRPQKLLASPCTRLRARWTQAATVSKCNSTGKQWAGGSLKVGKPKHRLISVRDTADDLMGWNVCIPDGFGTQLFGCEDEPELQLKGAAQKTIADRKEDWFPLLKLLEGGASIKEVVHLVGPDGKTALHLAAEWDRLEAVRALLKVGANPNAVSASTLTPLHSVAHYGGFDSMMMMLEHGAEFSARATAGRDFTPLHFCVWGQAPLAHFVAEGLVVRADIDATDSDGATSLHWAALGQPHLVELLLEHDAKADIVDNNGLTPLDWAAKPRARYSSKVTAILKQHLGKAD